MENLAGHRHASEIVERELKRCGVPTERIEHVHSEVPSLTRGKLGDFTFERAWYYYIVKGDVPLGVAKKLYEHPVGRSDIRVAGHCGCPPPQEWCRWRDYMGRPLVEQKQIDEVNQYLVGKEDSSLYDSLRNWLEEVIPIEFVPPDSRKGFVDLYHIDSELGLYIFVETLKQEKLV